MRQVSAPVKADNNKEEGISNHELIERDPPDVGIGRDDFGENPTNLPEHAAGVGRCQVDRTHGSADQVPGQANVWR